MARLEDLKELREGTQARMLNCASDQNYAALGKLLTEVIRQIEELEPPVKREETPLDDFTRKLRERQSGTTVPGSAATN